MTTPQPSGTPRADQWADLRALTEGPKAVAVISKPRLRDLLAALAEAERERDEAKQAAAELFDRERTECAKKVQAVTRDRDAYRDQRNEAERERAELRGQLEHPALGLARWREIAAERSARCEHAERQVREIRERIEALVNDLTKEVAILLRNPPTEEYADDYAEFVVKRCNRLTLIRDRIRAALSGVSGPTTEGVSDADRT